MNNFVIRQAQESDLSFIVYSWLKTYWHSQTAKKLMWSLELQPYAKVLDQMEGGDRDKPNVYYALQRLLIKRILEVSFVHLAYYDDDHDLFLGWACAEPERNVLHYVCVKPEYHGLGLAKELILSFGFSSETELKYTHKTDDLSAYTLPKSWSYCPLRTIE